MAAVMTSEIEDTLVREKIGRKPKLSPSQMRVLSEKLRRRRHLLEELAQYSIKRLAHDAGVSHDTVTRIDYAIHADHQPDPLTRIGTHNDSG